MFKNIRILENPEKLYKEVAQDLINFAQKTIVKYGEFYLALSGGVTPRGLFQCLASHYRDHIRIWKKTHIFLSDERYVAYQHPDNNYRQLYELLLKYIPIPENQLHPIPTHYWSPKTAAEVYERILKQTILRKINNIPQLDFILYGIGIDGHIASLFPNTPILHVKNRLVDAVYVESTASWRVSLTFPILNAASRNVFLLSGKKKADILSKLILSTNEKILPVQMLDFIGEKICYADKECFSNNNEINLF